MKSLQTWKTLDIVGNHQDVPVQYTIRKQENCGSPETGSVYISPGLIKYPCQPCLTSVVVGSFLFFVDCWLQIPSWIHLSEKNTSYLLILSSLRPPNVMSPFKTGQLWFLKKSFLYCWLLNVCFFKFSWCECEGRVSPDKCMCRKSECSGSEHMAIISNQQ